mmetsp:Transcript_14731/g.48965  ORF Transcript_14731/g.48965 Transcript_14731/m.48965 type:complete len:295 (-) Transcript_14731:458-1342(-)
MSKRPSGSSAAAQKKKMLTRDRFKYRLMRVNPTDFDVEELSAAQLVAFEQRHPQIAARWINGEDAAPSWQQSCGSILKGLMATKTAAPFNTPVDPVALNLPDYFTIVENPMDFGTVRLHLSGGKFGSADDFKAAVHLTLNNAMRFNPPGNLVHEDARKLLTTFDRKFASLHLDAPPPPPAEREALAQDHSPDAPQPAAAPAAAGAAGGGVQRQTSMAAVERTASASSAAAAAVQAFEQQQAEAAAAAQEQARQQQRQQEEAAEMDAWASSNLGEEEAAAEEALVSHLLVICESS